MTTPVGWNQANLLYDKLPDVPEPGSLQEAVCLLVSQYRSEQAFYSVLLSVTSDEKKEEIFTRYRDAMFPHLASEYSARTKQSKELLEEVFAEGPFVLLPPQHPDVLEKEAEARRQASITVKESDNG